jgi:hypothetical protein
MIVSSVMVMDMRNWMFVLFAMQSSIRSNKMILLMQKDDTVDAKKMILLMQKKSPLRSCGISL